MRSLPLLTGDTVLLRVVPVDPRDMFRGDYVTLGYDISRVTAGQVKGLTKSFQDSRGQISLCDARSGGRRRTLQRWRGERRSTFVGKFIRGTIEGWNRITFGIESYYVQEGTGHDYEAPCARGISRRKSPSRPTAKPRFADCGSSPHPDGTKCSR